MGLFDGGDEEAILKVTPDLDDAALRRVEQRIESSHRRQAQQAEASAKRQEAAAERVSKKQLAAIGIALVAWQKFFKFLESGSSEGSKALRELDAATTGLKKQLAGAMADAIAPFVRGLTAIVEAAGRSSSAIEILGRSAMQLISPITAAMTVVSQFVDILNAAESARARAFANEVEARQPDEINAAEVLDQRLLGMRDAAARMRAADDAAAIQMALDVNRRDEAARRRALERYGRRGGGGGGGADFRRGVVQEEDPGTGLFAEIESDMGRRAEGIKRSNEVRDDANRAQYERERARIEELRDFEMTVSRQRADFAIAEKERETQAYLAFMDQQRAATMQMVHATTQLTLSRLLETGSIDKALRSGLAAIGTQAAFRAAFEAAEAVAALVTPGMQGFAAGHAKAAAMFAGIAASAAITGKVMFGSNYGRQSNGGRGGGGGGDLTSGYGGARGGGGSGGVQKIEHTYIIRSSGDMVESDRTLRRIARHIRDTRQRYPD